MSELGHVGDNTWRNKVSVHSYLLVLVPLVVS